MDVGKFTSGVIGVVVALLVVTSVALPTITTAAASTTDSGVKAMINVLPLLLVVAIVLAVIGMFIVRGRGE